jgi:hypothetical protein
MEKCLFWGSEELVTAFCMEALHRYKQVLITRINPEDVT